ncbi:MAG: twin-arginine translocase TatA/TatE family subunit [Bacteroidales bacterium]|nr:twin-arginine translocase TatA/TatE family subunit [Bacteroidales bacterium]
MKLLGVIGGSEIIVILLLVLVLFGGKKIPELMRGLGKGVKEYKKAMNGIEEEVNGTPQTEQTEQKGEPNNTVVSD